MFSQQSSEEKLPMRVSFVTVSNNTDRKTYIHNVDEALVEGVQNHRWTRIAFGGRTKRGRAGVAFDVRSGIVSGHKIEPIPTELVKLVRHVPITQARTGLGYLLGGEDVLIGSEKHGLLLRRYGHGIEVFGSGNDSYQPHP